MRNKAEKLSVEKVLDSMHLEPINAHILDNAKTRVWNKLSHSIDNFENTNKMSQIEQTAPQKTFWNKYHKSFLSFGIVALVIVSTVGTTAYLTLKDNDKNQTAQTDKRLADNSGSLDDIKLLAAQRFEALTGITYDEYQVVAANAKNTEKNAQENATLANGIGSTQGFAAQNQGQNSTKIAPTLDPIRVSELNTKAEKNKIKVYYTESEVSVANVEKLKKAPFGLGFATPSLSYGSSINPNVDISKPLTVKFWFGNNYSKEVVSQNGKILSMHIFTPEFDLDFRGGKYAVRAAHSNAEYYFMGLTENEDQNPDLYFIKHVLSGESTFKKTGTKIVDGKTLTIFEDNVSTDMISSASPMMKISDTNMKIKYYVDVENLQVNIVENYADDVLVVSTMKRDTKEYTENASQIVSDYSELSNTEVKNISRDTGFAIEVKEPKLVDMIKKYPIYHINGERVSSVYDGSAYEKQQQEDPYLKLVNTKDFDPNFGSDLSFVDGVQAPTSSYGQGNLYFNIHKAKPIRFDNALRNDDKSYKVVQTPVVVQIDGKNVNATLYTETYNFTNTFNLNNSPEKNSGAEIAIMPASSTNNTVVFESNGYWYEVSESVQENGKKPVLTSGPLKLTTLSREDAVRMDAENLERNTSYPELQYGITLGSIAKDMRLLPGDLSESHKVVAQMSATSKQSSKSCEKFTETLNVDCLMSKFGGFRIDFGTKYDEKVIMSNGPIKSNYFQYTVLNAKASEVSPLIEKIKENGYYGSMVMTTKEINGKTIIISGDMSQDQVNKILGGVSIDNGLDALSKQLDSGANGGNPMPVDMIKEPATFVR